MITPCLDGARFIEETIESVLAQTHEPIEHLIVDGGSTDGTQELVERLAEAHPGRIRLIRGPEGSGPWQRRNLGLAESSGSVVCSLDADDVWMPEKVERQVALMEARPEVGLVYTYFDAFDSETGDVLPWSDARHDWEGDLLAPLWVKACFVAAQTVMVRREALDERVVRAGDEPFQFGDDWWVWLGVSLSWQGARIDEVMTRYRRHDRNESTRFQEESNPHIELIGLMREFTEWFPEAGKRLGRWRRIGLGRHYARASAYERAQGNRWAAARYRARAAALDPRGLLSEARLDRMLRSR